VRHGVFTPNFGVFSDAAFVADLAASAESADWDGWFHWDHVVHRGGDEPAADPWMTLALIAANTSRIALGPMVTPLPRRRPWNVARQATTLDHISRGRAILGVGIGATGTPEFDGFAEEVDLRRRGSMLDEGLELVRELWSGEEVDHVGEHYRVQGVTFVPRPVQDPLPIWIAEVWPAQAPLRRAARYQGVVPLRMPGPETLAKVFDVVGEGKEIVVVADSHSASSWEGAGATWMLHGISAFVDRAQVEGMVKAGPPR